MNKGKTIFAQVMSLANEYEFMVMSFAQFTDRSGLRDNETTLDLYTSNQYRPGLKAMSKSNLAEANEKKDWHIYQDFAHTLIHRAKELYKGQKLRFDFDKMVYTFDSSTIELFFKRIKQHLHIKTFYGTTRNAVFTQIWIAICDHLLLIIAKKHYMLEPSLHPIPNSIGQVIFKRANIPDLFNGPAPSIHST